jgi:cytochrome c oxidase cbb3-type subunit IV
MLRFIKHHLASESGVEFYGIFSLMIFVLFFLIVLIRMWKMKKSVIEELSSIPLDSDNVTPQTKKP